MTSKPELPVLEFSSQQQWADWLEQNHAQAQGVWVKFAKKGSGARTVTYAEAVEEALCYGWIDGQAARHDDSYYLQRFTPRRARSRWSQINCGRAERLIAQKRMKAAGLAQVEAARDDGRWEAAYAPPSAATTPEDLQRALDENREAKAFFETLNAANRYAIIYRLNDAKRPETRARRLAEYVAMLAEHRTLH
jgi:uncharacterized protein YdeI (YjbR/CyaY-like superfamily)